MLRQIFLSVSVLFSSFSIQSQNLLTISLDNPGKLDGVLNVTEIGSEFRYIPLQTSPGSLIGKVRQVEFDGEHLVVADADRVLFFDKTGRFVHQIGSSGEGPGEYNMISDIALNRSTGVLAVLPIFGKQIMLYDLGNHHLLSMEVNPRPDNVTWSADGCLIGAFNDKIMLSARNGQVMVAVYDSQLKLLRKYVSHLEHEKIGNATIMLPTECLHSAGRGCWFKWCRNDTLYTIENQEMIPVAWFDFQKVRMPFDAFTVENLMKKAYGGDYLQFKDVIVARPGLFFQYKWNQKEYYGVYQQENITLFLIGTSGNPEKIKDNIDFGPGFWPLEVYNGQLIDWFDPVDLKDLVKWTKKTGVSLKVDDNPVIRLLKTK